MFKNLILFRIADGWQPPTTVALHDALSAQMFVPCGASQDQSDGWIEPRGEKHGELVESVAGELILKLKSETKSVPVPTVMEKLEERLDKIEQETGRRPKGKQAKELKEDIARELLPQAFSKKSTMFVWVSAAGRFVAIDSGSMKATDRIATLLLEALGNVSHGTFRLDPLQTHTSPATAMALWLTEQEGPSGFAIDRECELKQPDSEKSAVRYSHHALDIEQVIEHIQQGKVPTKLAMTWDNRVSFVLTDDLCLKRLKMLDVVFDGKTGDDSGFDADVVIATPRRPGWRSGAEPCRGVERRRGGRSRSSLGCVIAVKFGLAGRGGWWV
jgi:recombination associated protein RdgC